MLLLVSALANTGGMCQTQREVNAGEIPSDSKLNFNAEEH